MLKTKSYIEHISVKKLVKNPDNPFKNIEDGNFVRLLKSIEKVGILEPVIVREVGDKYEIISGQRRFEAAKILGYKTVPTIIYEVNKDEATVLTVDSNSTFSEVRE